jgi:hypothetical protein
MSKLHAALLGALLAAAAAPARAASMQLGVQDFTDGQVLGCFSPTMGCAFGWTSPSDPFNRFAGSDPGIAGATDFAADWSFDLRSIDWQTLTSLRIEFGLYDHDSSASGSQLDSFSVSGMDLSDLLAPALEAPGIGKQQEYDVFSIDIPQDRRLLLRELSDAVARFSLKLKGPAWIKEKSGAIVEAAGSNGAGLDFARLSFTYGATAPEPAGALLAGLALAALAAVRGLRG